jgi:enoyl-CoA hydratase/carnithine racemase
VVPDPLALALETAREIAGKSPDAVRGAKRILNAAVVADPAAGLLQESFEQEKLIGSANQVEAINANLEKRSPNFEDR